MSITFVLAALLVCHNSVGPVISIGSYTADRQLAVSITNAALLASPPWDGKAENPPLSARKAIALASTKKDKLVKDSEDWKWHLESASLRPSDEGRWFWLVSFVAYPQRAMLAGVPPTLRLVVLMDGTVVEPKVTR
jgi:hypothetical protein